MIYINKKKIITFFFIILFHSPSSYSNVLWKLDNDLSELKLELPMLMADNISGSFNNFNSSIYIDNNEKLNKEFILSINVNSLDIDKNKLKNLLLSEDFFYSIKYPLIILKIKNIKIQKNQNINANLTIKNNIYELPINLSVIELTKNLIQVKIEFTLSRKLYGFEKNKLKSNFKFVTQEKSILLDKFKFDFDLFYNRK